MPWECRKASSKGSADASSRSVSKWDRLQPVIGTYETARNFWNAKIPSWKESAAVFDRLKPVLLTDNGRAEQY